MTAANASDALIDCRDVRFSYGRRSGDALAGIDFQVQAGSIMALVGPNGAGKSTLLNILLGIHPADSGSVKVMGHDPWGDRRRLASVATFVSDVASLPKWIRIGQLLEIMKTVHPGFREGYFIDLMDRVRLATRRECGSLSKGQLAYVHLALALAVDAQLLILDEPTLGLDVAARKLFHNRLLADYCRGGRSLVVTTHYPDELVGLVTHAAFMSRGKVTLAESVESLAERYQVVTVANADRARGEAAGPLHTQAVLGGVKMLFDTQAAGGRQAVEQLGSDVTGATLSDVYLAQAAEHEGETIL